MSKKNNSKKYSGLCRKSLLLEKHIDEILREICYKKRISFSHLIREMVDFSLENNEKII